MESDQYVDDFLDQFERALPGAPSERAAMVATIRGYLQEAADAGNLDDVLKQMGSPSDVAARFVENGPGHEHLDAVSLPDGTTVWASSFPRDGYDRTHQPDFGLYLDSRWQPPWPHSHVEWADFGLPADQKTLADNLDELLSRARSGERVEVGCLGGHGRTGTAIACLAVLAGISEDPVGWVRSVYCEHAVETKEQAELVHRFYNDPADR